MTIPSTNELHNLLGKITLNLRAVEYVVRWYLYLKKRKDTNKQSDPFFQFDSRTSGDVEDNELTDASDLSFLIDAYNAIKTPCVEKDRVCLLRHAFAHGRIVGVGANSPYRLVKYSKKKNAAGTWAIEFNEPLSREWLRDQIDMLVAEHNKVAQVMQADFGIGPQSILLI